MLSPALANDDPGIEIFPEAILFVFHAFLSRTLWSHLELSALTFPD
jgi:hypothetical protein